MKTLILIDVQNDFMPGGSLSVPHGNEIVPVINKLLPKFDLVVATQDWHPHTHKSFASNHEGKEVFEVIDLNGLDPEIDSYSGFYDNGHKRTTGLAGYLKEKGAEDLYFCGLAADICVYFTLMDGLQEGFSASLIEDASRPLDNEEFAKLKDLIKQKGGRIVSSEEI